METQAQTSNQESIMHYTFQTKAKEIQFAKIVKALGEINAKDRLGNLKNFESVLDNALKRAKLILDANEIEPIKQETFSKLIGFSLPMIKKYLALGKEMKADNYRDKVVEFKALNKGRLERKEPVSYGIDTITDYLRGKEIYKSEAQKQAERDKKENDRLRKKAESEAQKQAESPSPSPSVENSPSPSPSENSASYTFNPILFGFENDTIGDITLNIIHSPKNTAKPYLVTSNVPSFVLRAMFEKILRHSEKCEADKETIEQYEESLADELSEADYTTFDSDHIRIAR